MKKQQLLGELHQPKQQTENPVDPGLHCRRMERELCELRAVLDSASDAIITNNLDGAVTRWNPGATEIFGYDANEMIGRPIAVLAPMDRHDQMREIHDRVSEGDRVDHFETVCEHKNGSLVHVSLTVSPVIDTDGQVIGASTIARDISLQKQEEMARQRQTLSLKKRGRELECLYNMSYLIDACDGSLREILQGAVELLPPAWQYPEITCARLRIVRFDFTTKDFKETPWKQDGDIIVAGHLVGSIEIFYREERPEADEGPFLKEERLLLECICERLGRVVERIRGIAETGRWPAHTSELSGGQHQRGALLYESGEE
jgi:PAS domain S-box-containing protein